jgi:hypothetical protein
MTIFADNYDFTLSPLQLSQKGAGRFFEDGQEDEGETLLQ